LSATNINKHLRINFFLIDEYFKDNI